MFNDLAHFGNRIHIDTGLGGAHIHAGADTLRGFQCLRNGVHQNPVALGTAFLHQCGEAADEIDTTFLGCLVHGNGQRHIGVRPAGIAYNGNRCYGNTLIDDRNAKLPLDLLAHFHQILCTADDLFIDLPGAGFHILMGAVQQGDAHSDGADIQMSLVDHVLS